MTKAITLLLSISMLTACTSASSGENAPGPDEKIEVFKIDLSGRYQTIRNFGASDAWSIQFVGKHWPETSKEEITELLFSTENTSEGQPKGIGLSAWRFNIGGGSSEQGSGSEITDEWRRAECFLNEDGSYNWAKQSGQVWFLQEAERYGVSDLIGFVNSPPVFYTKNGKTWSEDGLSSNLQPDHYKSYAQFLAAVVKGLKQEAGVGLDYISPFNEPQWGWECCKQEGSPWNNDELAEAARTIEEIFNEQGITETKIEITDAGQIDFLFGSGKSPKNRGDQVWAFFDPSSPDYLAELASVAGKITGHSYFSTWDRKNLVEARLKLNRRIREVNADLEYWVSEYCLLEANQEIEGNGRDLGMDPAIYLSRVIHADLVYAHASAWQWWLAVSPYDYKDGLLYIDKDKQANSLYESKMLWTLGNYSRFIRPGSVRIGIEHIDSGSEERTEDLLSSAYQTADGALIVVFTNQSPGDRHIKLDGVPDEFTSIGLYQTSEKPEDNLRLVTKLSVSEQFALPARSVVTCVLQK